MYLHPEQHVQLIALRQAEIRREVVGEHVIRQGWRMRVMSPVPHQSWSRARRLGSALVHIVAGSPQAQAA